jgi:hypothetical protein
VACADYSGQVLAYDVAMGDDVDLQFDSQQDDACGLAVSADGTRLVEIAGCTFGAPTIVEWQLDGGGPISKFVDNLGGDQPGRLVAYGFGADSNALVAELGDVNGEFITSLIDPRAARLSTDCPVSTVR